MDNKLLAYTKYHIIFILKYHWKVIYGKGYPRVSISGVMSKLEEKGAFWQSGW